MNNEDTTRNLTSRDASENSPEPQELLRLTRLIADDLKGLRTDFEQYKLRTTPLAETLDAIRVEVRSIAGRQDDFGKQMAELRGEMAELRGEMGELRGKMNELERVVRRVETKLDGFATLLPGMQGTLHYHSVRLLELEAK